MRHLVVPKRAELPAGAETPTHSGRVPPLVSSAFESSTRAARKCSQEFEQVKSQRLQLFVGCLEHVSTVIDRIYKRICRNDSAQVTLREFCRLMLCLRFSLLCSS